MVNVQAPVPEQAPLQPANTYSEEAGVAVSVTVSPALIGLVLVQVPEVAPKVEVQLMPPVPVTVPLPVPAPVTVTVVRLKVALTDCAEFMVTEQAPVPVQAPPQPAKADPAGAAGVSVTTVPCVKENVQVPGQLIPAGALVIVPDPVPVVLTVRVKVGVGASARLWEPPLAMASAPERLLTWTGVLLSVVVPLPNWPEALCPQAQTVPSLFSAML
jgi:hypothetical protein